MQSFMVLKYYQIKMYEETEDGYVLVKTLPFKFLNKQHAEIKVKLLDANFHYSIDGVYGSSL